MWFAIKAGSWVTVANPAADAAGKYAQVAHIVNQCLVYVFVSAAIFRRDDHFQDNGIGAMAAVACGAANVGSAAKEGNQRKYQQNCAKRGTWRANDLDAPASAIFTEA
jgi:hypothetical protein